MEKITLVVDAGKASLGQLSNRINSLGFNSNEIQKEINEKTKEFSGLRVEVTITLDEKNKKYEIKVKPPSVADLVKKELKLELIKISEEDKAKGKTTLGNLTMEQVKKIAKIKAEQLGETDINKVLKMVISSIDTLPGILIEGKKPKELLKNL
ncbi:MAG: 50S ribosomal protein L11 [Candidatus Aenigmarchaeota archaeon]|nr:50S ribosomal protein L11 [Candidatus Aenigmarchaeota archaeon]MDW8160012.1 50S ribosomal protein L11 [Candidatus Aenigmarchaeota archaeon]